MNDDIDRAASGSDDEAIDYEEESSYIQSDPEQVYFLIYHFNVINFAEESQLEFEVILIYKGQKRFC